MDGILTRKVNSYFDLSFAQQNKVLFRIRPHLKWLRTRGFRYGIVFFKRIRASFINGLKEVDVVWMEKRAKVLFKKVFARVLDDVAWFFTIIDKEQVQYFKNKLREFNKKLVDLIALTPEKRLAKRYKLFIKTIEKWTDDLNDNQKNKIRVVFKNIQPDISKERLRFMRFNQGRFLSILGKGKSKQFLKKHIRLWFMERDTSVPLWFRKALRREAAGRRKLMVLIYKMLNKAQKDHLRKRCTKFIEQQRGLLK